MALQFARQHQLAGRKYGRRIEPNQGVKMTLIGGLLQLKSRGHNELGEMGANKSSVAGEDVSITSSRSPAVGIITLILIWKLQAGAVEITQQRSKRARLQPEGQSAGP